jgi:DNA-binding MarR family transcriptional regulator
MDRTEHVGEIIDAWHRIKQALCVRFAKTDTHLPHSQWAVLNVMTGRTTTTVKDIAEALAITGSAATQLVNELVTKGYLSKKQHPNDKRSVLRALTPKCMKDLHTMRTQAIVYSSDIFSTFSDAELATYAQLTKKII